jgi:hypothetical protein
MNVGPHRAASFAGLALAIGALVATAACSSSSGGGPPPADASSEFGYFDAGFSDAPGDATIEATSDAPADTAIVDAPSEASACPAGQMLCSAACVDTKIDPGNCGACGTKCTSGHVCSNGQCSLSCGGGTTQCGSSCIDTNVDPNNCGSCSHACPAGQLCSAGQCATQCGGGLTMCPGAGGGTPLCVDEQSDPVHCGTCTTVCPTGSACSAGNCTVACPGMEVNCNGLCIDPSKDDQYCGATGACGTGGSGSAGTQCPSGQVCNGGACSVTCPGTEINCGGRCVDPSSDPHHCGATAGCGVGDAGGGAGAQCPSGEVCASGKCSVSCPGNEINCNGTCIDPASSNQYCGATVGCGTGGMGNAGQNCTTRGEVCTPGGCSVTCPGNEINCNGTCVDPTTNDDYCGATAGCGTGDAGSAGVNCNIMGEVCTPSGCQVNCPIGEVNCGGICIDPATSALHCGATDGCGGTFGTTGVNCQAMGEVCDGNGGCTPTCPGMEVNCGGKCIDPGSNMQHCGATGACGVLDAGLPDAGSAG